MTNEIPPENTITIDEMQNAFSLAYGSLIGRLTLENLDLKKQFRAAQARLEKVEKTTFSIEQDNANLLKARAELERQIHTMEETETALLDHIKDMEFQLKKADIAEEIAGQAQKMIDPQIMSDAAAEIAAQANKIVGGENVEGVAIVSENV